MTIPKARSSVRIVLALAATMAQAVPAAAQKCSANHTCRDFSTCADALADFRLCRRTDLDRDGDGIPCETLCGGDAAAFGLRQAAPAPGGFGLIDAGGGFSCRPRKTCGQMASCDEARYHLESCGNRRLDRDRDGTPCEGLCR
ncbi:excalibur calcium-binding domain-containing protein [Methylobrevis albus]|uniref:Excalibur calcium-binding domain-containing protein n=1 Tax=Methylobrevis albus TaxID=2793297 RepID=A0A931I0V5_9HYPH|nr:excalibur calcium-binding domain-containing protein [Methylobrevis albus]MBH0236916.1 excalibur calcium-binding domain-containing protein [Methylobrevis albus]